jgi:Cu/Ag efflux protein CusF
MTRTSIGALAALAALTAAPLSYALTPGSAMKDMPGMPMQAGGSAQLHSGKGVVKQVDAGRGLVTFNHEAIPSLKWSAMTMQFPVADRKMLEALKPGTAVSFQLRDDGKGRYVVTDIKH